jgi:hypothetical protein
MKRLKIRLTLVCSIEDHKKSERNWAMLLMIQMAAQSQQVSPKICLFAHFFWKVCSCLCNMCVAVLQFVEVLLLPSDPRNRHGCCSAALALVLFPSKAVK